MYLFVYRKIIYDAGHAGKCQHTRDYPMRHFMVVSWNQRAETEDWGTIFCPRVRRRGLRANESTSRPSGRTF